MEQGQIYMISFFSGLLFIAIFIETDKRRLFYYLKGLIVPIFCKHKPSPFTPLNNPDVNVCENAGRIMTKLYAWQPQGHGEYSFFVMAESEQQAKEAIDKYLIDENIGHCEQDRWGTDYYELTVVDPLQVIINEN